MRDSCSMCSGPVRRRPESLPNIICSPCRKKHDLPIRGPARPKSSDPRIRHAKKLTVRCTVCDDPMWFRAGSVAAVPCCLRCRRATPLDAKVALGILVPPSAQDRARREREAAAPGLRDKARRVLLAKWKRQSRRCAYCPAAATTIDHVIPLSRGGTNFEGNLAPACRSCNSSKCARLVVEFRMLQPPLGREPATESRRPNRARPRELALL